MHAKNSWNSPIDLLREFYPGSFPLLAPEPPPAPATGKREIFGLLTTEEAADYLGVKPETVRVLVRRKTIDVVRITPRDYRFRQGDLESFVTSRLCRRDSALRRTR
jgi:excisionase family DNA binding protein